jgi:hypothetical protein
MDGSPNIWHALNKDTLEEVAGHCSVDTLLNLQQTCTSFSQLLTSSERVWFGKLAKEFGLYLKVRLQAPDRIDRDSGHVGQMIMTCPASPEDLLQQRHQN